MKQLFLFLTATLLLTTTNAQYRRMIEYKGKNKPDSSFKLMTHISAYGDTSYVVQVFINNELKWQYAEIKEDNATWNINPVKYHLTEIEAMKFITEYKALRRKELQKKRGWSSDKPDPFWYRKKKPDQ